MFYRDVYPVGQAFVSSDVSLSGVPTVTRSGERCFCTTRRNVGRTFPDSSVVIAAN